MAVHPEALEGGSRDEWGMRHAELLRLRLSADGEWLLYPVSRHATGQSGQRAYIELTARGLATGAVSAVAREEPISGSSCAARTYYDISPNGQWVVYVGRGSDPLAEGKGPPRPGSASRGAGRVRGPCAPPPAPLSGGGTEGTLFAVSRSDPSHRVKLGECILGDTEDLGAAGESASAGCDGFILSPDGERLAYSDGRGLWLVDITGTMRAHEADSGSGSSSETAEGSDALPRAELLRPHSYSPPGGDADIQIHRPLSWSPDGRRLIAAVHYHEGSARALWDVVAADWGMMPESTEYHGCQPELAWLNDGERVVRALAGCESTAPLATLPADGPAAATPLVRCLRLPYRAEFAYDVISPQELPDGRIGFATRSANPALHRGSGVFAIHQDGSGWEAVAPLPPMASET